VLLSPVLLEMVSAAARVSERACHSTRPRRARLPPVAAGWTVVFPAVGHGVVAAVTSTSVWGKARHFLRPTLGSGGRIARVSHRLLRQAMLFVRLAAPVTPGVVGWWRGAD